MRRSVGALVLHAALAVATLGAAPAWAVGTRRPPREVLAFYYGWYGNPRVSGQWVHWKAEAGEQRASNITDTPRDGLYDSHDPAEVAHEAAEARKAGVTGFIADWWGQNNFTDQSMAPLLAAAHRIGLKVTAIIDKNLAGSDVDQRERNAVSDIMYLLRRYGDDPSWLRVGDRPVLFLYDRAAVQLPLPAWRDVLRQARAKAPHGVVVIGPSYDPAWLSVFDGADEYNVTGATHGLSLAALAMWARGHYSRQVATAGRKISCVTVIPGYDDSHTSRPPPHPITLRRGGQTYAVLWQEALAAHPDWILITTWNEWHEGTEIEPSREYGDAFLTITRAFATRFLAPEAKRGRSKPR